MPRVADVYDPPHEDVVTATPIESAVFNSYVNDITSDLNTPRPVKAGGTGASTADGALVNLQAEKAAQVVANFDTHIWVAGSFFASTAASGGPVASHNYVGTLVKNTSGTEMILEAYDVSVTPAALYIRRKAAGSWQPWELSELATNDARYVNVNGDTMSAALILNYVAPTLILDKTVATNTAAIWGRSAGNLRWIVRMGDQTAEGGSNTGSNFVINRYNDAGDSSLSPVPLTITRDTGLGIVAGPPTVTNGIATKGYVDTNDDLKVDIAGDTMTGNLLMTSTLNHYNARISAHVAIANTASFEWGHTNVLLQYGNTIGVETGSGQPFIGFSCGPGTNASTYKTGAFKGTIIRGDIGGGLGIFTAAASTDNQTFGSLTALMTLSTLGVVDIPGELVTQGGAACYGNIPVQGGIKTGAYTCVLSDQQKMVIFQAASVVICTIPAHASVAYPIGTCLTFINRSATYSLTIRVTTESMYLSGGANLTGDRSLATNSMATAIKTSNTTWLISGAGLT